MAIRCKNENVQCPASQTSRPRPAVRIDWSMPPVHVCLFFSCDVLGMVRLCRVAVSYGSSAAPTSLRSCFAVHQRTETGTNMSRAVFYARLVDSESRAGHVFELDGVVAVPNVRLHIDSYSTMPSRTMPGLHRREPTVPKSSVCTSWPQSDDAVVHDHVFIDRNGCFRSARRLILSGYTLLSATTTFNDKER